MAWEHLLSKLGHVDHYSPRLIGDVAISILLAQLIYIVYQYRAAINSKKMITRMILMTRQPR